MTKEQALIVSMLKEDTGKALCDSGDAYGRNWQINKKKSFLDFQKEPRVKLYKNYREAGYDPDDYTISLYHYLEEQLDLDEVCERFNNLPVRDWRGKYYGVSELGERWLRTMGFIPKGEAVNTYNSSAPISQIIQYQVLESPDEEQYILLQIHGGCDARGGYTDAKLFKIRGDEYFGRFEVYGTIRLSNEQSFQVSNIYDGEILRFEEVGKGDVEGQRHFIPYRELPTIKKLPRDNERVSKYCERAKVIVTNYNLDFYTG